MGMFCSTFYTLQAALVTKVFNSIFGKCSRHWCDMDCHRLFFSCFVWNSIPLSHVATYFSHVLLFLICYFDSKCLALFAPGISHCCGSGRSNLLYSHFAPGISYCGSGGSNVLYSNFAPGMSILWFWWKQCALFSICSRH